MVVNVYIRGIGKKPIKMKCDYGLIDDGENCIKKNTCERKSCESNDTGCLECSAKFKEVDTSKENNNLLRTDFKIVKKLEDRLTCDKEEELDNGLCFKKCKHGYIPQGKKCVKGLSNKKNNTTTSIFIFLEKIVNRIKDMLNIQNLNNKNIQLIIGIVLFIFLITYYS